MITLKNYELELALVQLMAFDTKTQKPTGGLLMETLSLGLKRRLQKLHSKLIEKYKDYADDIKKIDEECGEDIDKRAKEISDLNLELVTIDLDPVDIKQIEAIVTSNNYNFEIIEKFAA